MTKICPQWIGDVPRRLAASSEDELCVELAPKEREEYFFQKHYCDTFISESDAMLYPFCYDHKPWGFGLSAILLGSSIKISLSQEAASQRIVKINLANQESITIAFEINPHSQTHEWKVLSFESSLENISLNVTYETTADDAFYRLNVEDLRKQIAFELDFVLDPEGVHLSFPEGEKMRKVPFQVPLNAKDYTKIFAYVKKPMNPTEQRALEVILYQLLQEGNAKPLRLWQGMEQMRVRRDSAYDLMLYFDQIYDRERFSLIVQYAFAQKRSWRASPDHLILPLLLGASSREQDLQRQSVAYLSQATAHYMDALSHIEGHLKSQQAQLPREERLRLRRWEVFQDRMKQSRGAR